MAWAQNDPGWQNLQSKRGEIPVPSGGSSQQTAALVGDFEGNSINDFNLRGIESGHQHAEAYIRLVQSPDFGLPGV
jgi:hypothetical protein